MGRDGKCSRCGFKAPMISFYNEANDGRISAAIIKLPPQVQNNYYPYLSLFRPKSGCAVRAEKAERLTNELAELVNKGYVSQKHQVDRPCPPRIWAQAMEQMMERAGSLTLPMPNHNYLRTIAWDLANKEDAGKEKTNRQYEAQGQRPTPRGVDPLEKARLEWDEKHAGESQPARPYFVIKGME